MDTEKDFEEATGTGVDETDLAALEVVDDEEVVVDDDKLADDTLVDPLLGLDDEQKDPEEEDDLKSEIEDYIFSSKYDDEN
ncbi:MAG: hypothetical protein JWM92_448 [Candidatus Nomurabacteria bacterium]|jgi:hypothetical protein|nr:hypothetical protein [Candidatus Nomurabacteria bacterium]